MEKEKIKQESKQSIKNDLYELKPNNSFDANFILKLLSSIEQKKGNL